jgi:hypothetical protein
LIEADTEGRVRDRDEPTPDERVPYTLDQDEIKEHLEGVTFPSTVDRAEAIEAIQEARSYLYRHGSGTMREFVKNVMPRQPLGYDSNTALEKASAEGERYRGSWWRKVVKPGLEALPDVESPGEGGREWKIIPRL